MRRLSTLKEVLWVLAAFGAVAIVARLLGGLGASTGLSDSMPWGMWKILNMVAGVALATGGFTMAAAVYIFDLKKYKPLVKPAVVVAFLGYGSSCFALFLDIGLPHAIWKPVFFWNEHSFLFEVAWCVMLYFAVTILEIAPMPLERFHLRGFAAQLKKISLPIVFVGIVLSSLHHTSLGSLFLVMPARMHSLWFTPLLPALFILSAIGAGMQVVILVSLGYAHFYQRESNMSVLTGLAKGSAVILGFHLVLKIADLAWRGQFPVLFSGQWESGFLLVELLLGAVLPIALFVWPAARKSGTGLATAAVCAVAGLILNRLNVGITSLIRTADVSYFPTLAEFLLSVGIFAMAGLVFLFMIENLPIFGGAPTPDPEIAYGKSGGTWGPGLAPAQKRITLVVAAAIPLAIGMFVPGALGGMKQKADPARRPLAVDEPRAILRLNGNQNGGAVLFPHADHQARMGGEESCARCHHLDLPEDKSSSCYLCHSDMFQSESIFDHGRHVDSLGDKWSCQECHDSQYPKNGGNAVACAKCHEKMANAASTSKPFSYIAPSYMNAMHGMCIPCHVEQREEQGHAGLDGCQACHSSGERASLNVKGNLQ